MFLADILTAATVVISVVLSVYSFYSIGLALVSLLKGRRNPDAAPRARFAVLIAARNEEAVIGQLVESLTRQHYPRDLFDIIVIPNNCTDRTRHVAEQAGARILMCPFPVRSKGDVLNFVMKFQQLSGPVMAKGVEDTAFYRWTHLVSLNEVGGSPRDWGVNPDQFHRWCAQMAGEWPATMTCGTTHDTKRSEDVRNRIAVISQYARQWRALLTKLAPLLSNVEGHTENLFWQILAGTWTADGPIERDTKCAVTPSASCSKRSSAWPRNIRSGPSRAIAVSHISICSSPR